MRIYRNNTRLDIKKYNFTFHQGGLGDMIACLPAVKYVLDTQPNIYINMWVHDYAVDLCKSVFKDYKMILVRGMSDYKEEADETLPTRSPYMHKISNLSSNMVEHGFYTIVGSTVEDKYKNYLQLDPINISHFNLPEKYVVITTGYTSDTREWIPSSVNEVSDYVISKGYTPVYLGRGFTPAYNATGITGKFNADYTKGINLIDKTNLFEAHTIMSQSKCVFGLDNGLLHLAAMSSVPIIYGFTTVIPGHRLPYRGDIKGKDCYVVMPTEKELGCIGCQSKMTFADTTHNFVKCFYGPLDYKCLDLMSSDKWIVQFEKMLEPKTPEEKAEAAYQQIIRTQELNQRLKELGVTE